MAKRRSKPSKAVKRRIRKQTAYPRRRGRIKIDPFEMFAEWFSPADEKAYAKL